MKKIRKNQLAVFILCIAVILSSLQPAGTVYASALPPADATDRTEAPKETEAPESPQETEMPVPEETEAPEPAPIPGETPTAVPEETPSATDWGNTPAPSEIPTKEPVETPAGEPLESPEETPTGTPEETPTATPEETPSPTATPTESPADLDYILGRPMTEEEIAAQKAARPSNLPILPEEEIVEAYHSDFQFYAALEERYDSREHGYVTKVKDQNPFGTCWAHAAIASMEGSLLTAGLADSGVDLSEWHLAYFATHTGSDELGNTTGNPDNPEDSGDYVKPQNDERDYMDLGGNIHMAATALSNWKGAAREKDYPYPIGHTGMIGKTAEPDDAWKNNAYYMSNCYITPISDAKSVKALVKEFGGVYASYYDETYFYSFPTAAYFTDTYTYTNHAITIVGWDDNYRKENFSLSGYGQIDGKLPPGDGAWICKNSWGSGFGDEGYFYISYYDTSIRNSQAAAFVGQPMEGDLNNYYYGGGVSFGIYVYASGIAQCYEAHANEEGVERIEGVGFFSGSSSVPYRVQIYKNPDMEAGVVTNPETGEAMLAYPESGVTGYAGYTTIELSESVIVEEGDIFSVVVSFDKSVAVYADETHTMWSGCPGKYIYDSVNETAAGESFFKPTGWRYFYDSNETAGGLTPRMNVFTRDVDAGLAGLNNFYVYEEKEAGREELGSFSTWAKAAEYLSANGRDDADYRIAVMQNAAVKGSFTLPENIHGLIISSSVSEEGAANATLRIDNSIAAKCPLTFQNITLMPRSELHMHVGSYDVRLEQVSLKGKSIAEITGSGMEAGSFYTDCDLTVTGSVRNLSSLILDGCCFSAAAVDIGDLYLEEAKIPDGNTECQAAGALSVRNVINQREGNVLSVAASLDGKTGIWSSKLTITGTVSGNAVYVKLMERLTEETMDSVEFPDGNYYRPVSFYTNVRDGEGKYSFRSTDRGIYMQFNLAKAPLTELQMVCTHPDNCLPFGGTKEDYALVNSFKRSGNIVCRNQARTIVLSYENNGQKVMEDIATYQEAIDEINSLKVKRDYTIALLLDIDSADGNSLKPGAFTMPKADCVSHLMIEGDGHRLCFTGNAVTAASDITLHNITLVPLKANSDSATKSTEPFVPVMDARAAGYQYPAAVTLKMGNYNLTMEEDVAVEAPLLLNGGKGILKVTGTVKTPGYQEGDGAGSYVCSGLTEGIAGSISGFKEVSIETELSLRCYYTAAKKQTGGTFAAGNVEQKANLWVQGKMTADYLHQESGSELKVGIEESDGYTSLLSDAAIKDYRTSAGCSCIVTGKFTSAGKAGLYGAADRPVIFQAGKIAFKDVTLSHAEVTAGQDFAITGVTVSESADNKLITRQKADAKGKITDVYLAINGTVLLSEEDNKIEICVKAPDSEQSAVLKQAPSAEGLLLNAKTAEALFFLPAEENCGGRDAKLVKNGNKIYLYDADGAPIEVQSIRGGNEVFLGFFPTLEAASKAVDGKTDKTASYIFTLHSSLGETKPEKIVLPVNAAALTIRAEEGTGEDIVLHTAGDITLKTHTTLENITLSPDYGKGTANISMGKFRLSLKEIQLAEGKSINKIAADAKSSEALELAGSMTYRIGAGGITVSALAIGADTELVAEGKAVIGRLSLKQGAVLKVMQKGSAITDIVDYQSYSEGTPEQFSKLYITSGGDLTIKGSVENDTEGALVVIKEGISPVDELSGITAGNRVLTAPKAAASAFRILLSDSSKEEIPFKHEQGLYLPGADAEEGLLQVQLTYGENASKESRFIDWYQAVTEINTLNDASLMCQITLLDDIAVVRRLDAKGTVIIAPGMLLMPSAGKCDTLTVCGEGRSLHFTGNLTVNTSGIFRDVQLVPVKVNKGETIPSIADIVMKTNTNGITRLIFEQCGEKAAALEAGSLPEEILFGNVKGDGKGCEIYLFDDTAFSIKSNVTGLKGLYLGMNEEGKAAGNAVLGISGKAEVKTLGLMGTDGNTLEDTRLLVTGSLTADTLTGRDGILMVKQKSAKDTSTNAVVKGNSAIPAGKTMTVLVMQPDITNTEVYLQKLAERENPFIEEIMDIPLLQAPVMQAEHIKTAGMTISGDELQMQQLEGTVYYRDTKQYIKAGLGTDMKVRITARSESGASASTYAKSWYEAIQMLDGMGNNYTWYGLELLGNGRRMTGMNTKTGEETIARFLLPSKVKGTVEISREQESNASLIYTDNLKIPDKMTLVINEVPLEQTDSKGNTVNKGVTMGNDSTLTLIGGADENLQFSSIAGPKGSLCLDGARITVSGKTDIKNFYVSDEINELTDMGEIKIHTVLPLKEGMQGQVRLHTVSKYSKSKTGYDVTQLSQISINGRIDEKAEVGIHITRDSSVTGQDESVEYTLGELSLAPDEAVSARKRLAVLSGNAADEGITLINGEGTKINGESTNCLFAEEGGLYLSSESPSVTVSSHGGTTPSEYQGRFRSVEAALKAIGVSAKEDVTLSKGNLKSYRITFENQQSGAVTLNMPANVKELTFTYAGNDGRMKLEFKGSPSLKSDTSFEHIDLSAVDSKGAPAAASINAGNYKLALMQTKLSEKITLKGGAKGELVITDTDTKAAAVSGFGQVTIREAYLISPGNITAQNVYLERALLKGKNITISKKTEMRDSTLSAASDNEASSGKLKLSELYNRNQAGDAGNILAAKQDAKGNSGIEITGKVLAAYGEESGCFAIELYQNRDCNAFAYLESDMSLLTAAVADGDFFAPKYSTNQWAGMGVELQGYGVYKSGKTIRYGYLLWIEAVLINHTQMERNEGEPGFWQGGTTSFFSLEEALAEINSRKDKTVTYTVELVQDAEIRNAKGILTTPAMPSYADKITISSADNQQMRIEYTGNLTLKCNTVFENVNMTAYKTSGKNIVVTEGRLAGGNYELGISGTVEFGGSIQAGTITFEDGAEFICTSVKAANISCENSADLHIARGSLITVMGFLKKGSVTNITIHLDYGTVPNGFKIIEIKSLSGKADLAGLQIADTTGDDSYILYQDGRAVYCRRER